MNGQTIKEVDDEGYKYLGIKLHYLITEAYSFHYNLRCQRTYNVPAANTKRFANSFFVKCAAETNSSLRSMRPFNGTLSIIFITV